jgi:hypothetical protein
MKAVALWSALLFAGSPVVAKVCVLRCAGPAKSAVSTESHCGESSPSRTDSKRHPCGHGHRGETLVSSISGSKVVVVVLATLAPGGPFAAAFDQCIRPDAMPLVFESPPARSSPSVLRL